MLTQSGASEGGLHGVAVPDAQPPHDDASCSLFTLMNSELTAPERELQEEGTNIVFDSLAVIYNINVLWFYTGDAFLARYPVKKNMIFFISMGLEPCHWRSCSS